MKFFKIAIAAVLPVALWAAPANTSGMAGPTFNHDVAPMLYQNCSGCHRPGEVAPFALLTYDDAAKRAKQIAAITAARVMPPWKAEPGYGHFQDERRLTETQIATLREWAKNGAPEGDPAEKPAIPNFPNGWQAGEPDQIVKMTQPYKLPAEGSDVFRCFVIPLGADQDEYVKTVEFRAGNPKVVHHAILFMDTSGQGRKKESAPGEGYECVGGTGLSLSGALGGWAPGSRPSVTRPGLALTIKKGADLVMQLHYHLDGKVETDQSTVGITFTKDPPVKGLTLILVGNTGIDIPAGDDHYVVKASAMVPMDAEATAVFPHAHYLCKDMKVEAHLPDGTVEPMIWIKDWDFNWQGSYKYITPLKLPKGTRIDMEYVYDNSANNPHNPSNPPREVRYGEQTTNEMGFAFVSLTLDNPTDVKEFQSETSARFIASVVENGVYNDGLEPKRAAQMKALFNMFDKNKDGKLDADEREALIDFLKKQGARI
jgi:mono/diheme cytochrome c family protein